MQHVQLLLIYASFVCNDALQLGMPARPVAAQQQEYCATHALMLKCPSDEHITNAYE